MGSRPADTEGEEDRGKKGTGQGESDDDEEDHEVDIELLKSQATVFVNMLRSWFCLSDEDRATLKDTVAQMTKAELLATRDELLSDVGLHAKATARAPGHGEGDAEQHKVENDGEMELDVPFLVGEGLSEGVMEEGSSGHQRNNLVGEICAGGLYQEVDLEG